MTKAQIIKILATAAQSGAENAPKEQGNVKALPKEKTLKNDFLNALVDVAYGKRKE